MSFDSGFVVMKKLGGRIIDRDLRAGSTMAVNEGYRAAD
jgi:hypothetical protein